MSSPHTENTETSFKRNATEQRDNSDEPYKKTLKTNISNEDQKNQYEHSQSEILDTILKDLNVVKEDVAKLVKADYNTREKSKAPIKNDLINEDKQILLAKVTLARSISDIEIAGFSYSNEQNKLCCSVCSVNETDGNFSYNGVFTYDQSNGLSFSDDMNLPET